MRPVEGNPVVHIDSVHPPDLKMIEASQNHATSLEDIPEEDSVSFSATKFLATQK